VIFLFFYFLKLKGYFEYIQGKALRIKKKRERGKNKKRKKTARAKLDFFLAHTRSLMNAAL